MQVVPSKSRLVLALSLAFVLAFGVMAFGGCAADDDVDDPVNGDPVDAVPGGTINIGWIPWDEDIAVTYLWKALLEEQGYDIELTQLDVAPVFAGVAAGDLDLFLDVWLPVTHSDYWEQYGDSLESLGVWYEGAALTIAVPEYVDIDSLEDLPGNEDLFDGRIIGIEPGSGLMRVTREEVVPGYGLDGYEVIEGSTPAMLAELDRATSNEDPIVVTLWRPHWAYGAYPIKDLADPQGLLGDAEELSSVARPGFSAEFPDVAAWIGNFRMDDVALAELSQLVIDEYGAGQEEAAVEEWLSDPANRALADSWIN